MKSIMIGDEAAPLRHLLELSHPVEEGVVRNWEEVELLWDYGFKKMKCDPKGKRVLLTEAVWNPKKNRRIMAEKIFETFEFDKMQIGVQAVMSLFAEVPVVPC